MGDGVSRNVWEKLDDERKRNAELEAALRKSRAAIAQCFAAGAVIDKGDDTPWWNALIEAQQTIAATLRNNS